jgi:hypothetical protein
MEHSITLFLDPDWNTLSKRANWMTRHTDPAVIELFGGDVIPTAFTALTPVEEVVAYLRENWPGYEIKVEGEDWLTSVPVIIQ